MLGPTDCDVAGIVSETQSGTTCLYEDKQAIKQTIKQWYTHCLNNTPSTQPVGIEQFSFEIPVF